MNESLKRLKSTLDSIILGKEDVTKFSIITLLARGHLLIEDIPGVGKTTLAYALAKSTSCTFQRIQFTSDLLPSDIIGVNVYNPEKRDFEFKPGPIFANIVLADEINRTNPKTQSALLEAMNERRVSIDRKTYEIPEPFMVIATQNPIEYYGTFPLPESQLDRFMMHLRIGYPEPEFEKKALLTGSKFDEIEKLSPVISPEEIRDMQKAVSEIRVHEDVLNYLHHIILATRRNEQIRLGVSTRGGQFALQAAKAHAFFNGRDFVTPDDVKRVAPLVFGHRIILKTKTYISDATELIKEIISKIPVPV
ncbi:MAG: MoxR family ATPase [Thermodesulfovibrionales bacterium]|nr:MoxR family ATPase [Thermodesulfovibrionales bacterium]